LVRIDGAGRATKLSGDPEHPITRGFLCAKVTKYLEREYHPERLLYPLRRTGAKGEGRFERVSWDQALEEIAGRLKTISAPYGPDALLPYSYGGTLGILNGAGMDRRFFHRLGASRLDRTICSEAGGAALLASQGIKLGTEPQQFARSKLILAWGANILGTNVHLWPWIVEARRNGAKFYVIDPIKNRTGRAADKHFALNPGSDLALALGLVHVILRESWHDREYVANYSQGFEELSKLAANYPPGLVADLTGLPVQDIEDLARDYATLRPAAIRVNYGVQRSDRGGSAVRAIAALPVLTGSWRELGGGLQLSTSGAFQFNRAALEMPELQRRSPLGRQARLVNMSLLGHALTELHDPPVRALVVYNSNPAAVAPHQTKVLSGLRRQDLFTVVLEQFLTDTADYADFVLPVTTFLEHTDIYLAYGHYYLQLARPALPAPGETKSNVEIFRLLAQRLGFRDACFEDSEDDMIRSLLGTSSSFLRGITLEQLERERSVRLNLSPSDEPASLSEAKSQKTDQPFLPFANGGFLTPSGKFDFGAESLAYTAPRESRFGDADLHKRYPLELISGKNDDSLNSTFGHRAEVDRQTAVLCIHPEDAAARGIQQGALVVAFNDRGSCVFEATLSPDVRPGVIRARSVRWNKRSPANLGINQLTSERLTDLGSGPTFYSCLVEVKASGQQGEHQRPLM
jgi:anaerobic selenocysteine-containing dehydrogenase